MSFLALSCYEPRSPGYEGPAHRCGFRRWFIAVRTSRPSQKKSLAERRCSELPDLVRYAPQNHASTEARMPAVAGAANDRAPQIGVFIGSARVGTWGRGDRATGTAVRDRSRHLDLGPGHWRATRRGSASAPLRPTTDRGSGRRLCRHGSGDSCQRRCTRFRNACRDRKRHRRSQLFGTSHITQHDVGDGSIPQPDNDERARQSPLFPVMAKPSDSSPSERPASDRTAAGEQKKRRSNGPSDSH
jgi:hypothetical protein